MLGELGAMHIESHLAPVPTGFPREVNFQVAVT